MSVCDCEEGNGLLKAESQPNAGSVAREAFLEHIKQCPLCNYTANDPTESDDKKSPLNGSPPLSKGECALRSSSLKIRSACLALRFCLIGEALWAPNILDILSDSR
jgi:hypothetical protein